MTAVLPILFGTDPEPPSCSDDWRGKRDLREDHGVLYAQMEDLCSHGRETRRFVSKSVNL